MVQYFDLAHGGMPFQRDNPRTGLVVDVEYHVKPDDFLIFIMWPEADRPQALFQKDCQFFLKQTLFFQGTYFATNYGFTSFFPLSICT